MVIDTKEKSEEEMMELYKYDYCYECTGYGDDYYIDEHGDLVCYCPECPFNSLNKENEE